MRAAELAGVVTETKPLVERFVASGHRVFLVGGVVRDLALGCFASNELDIDLTTDANPEQIESIVAPIAEALWLQGKSFGTVGARVAGRDYEITTHRSEAYAPDSRKPQVAFLTDITEDLSRRDFTINAVAIELPSQEVIDPFSGLADLVDAVLRTPLDPEVSFADDPLRMLRAARFVAGYDLRPIADLVNAMRVMRGRIDVVSVERVRDELDKLLAVGRPGTGLALLRQTGLLECVLPELAAGAAEEAERVVDDLVADSVVRLAGLFYGIETGAAHSRLSALRYSKERHRRTISIIEAAQRLVAGEVVDAPSFRRWVVDAGDGREEARALAAVVPGTGQFAAERSLELESELADELMDLSPVLTGDEVMAELSLSAGTSVGEALSFLQDLRFEHGPMDPADARERLRSWWGQRQHPED